jgi:hypothetical protein
VALFETEYVRSESGAGFSMCLHDDRRLESEFFGIGHMDITYAFIEALEKVLKVAGPEPLSGIVILHRLEKAPLRSQFVLGKWLLNHKQHIARLALCGAKPWEAKIAKFIMKMARMKDFCFFDDTESGLAWLAG